MNNIYQIAFRSNRKVSDVLKEAQANGQKLKTVRNVLVFFPVRPANEELPRFA